MSSIDNSIQIARFFIEIKIYLCIICDVRQWRSIGCVNSTQVDSDRGACRRFRHNQLKRQGLRKTDGRSNSDLPIDRMTVTRRSSAANVWAARGFALSVQRKSQPAGACNAGGNVSPMMSGFRRRFGATYVKFSAAGEFEPRDDVRRESSLLFFACFVNIRPLQ